MINGKIHLQKKSDEKIISRSPNNHQVLKAYLQRILSLLGLC